MPRPIEDPFTGSADDLQAAEKRGYTKGYSAGRRRTLREGLLAWNKAQTRTLLAGLVFIGVTTATRPWKRGGKDLITPDDYAGVIFEILRALERRI